MLLRGRLAGWLWGLSLGLAGCPSSGPSGAGRPEAAPAKTPPPAVASPSCPWVDRRGELRVGRTGLLGERFERLPTDLRRGDDCFVSADRSTVDCELYDPEGFAYLSDEVGVVRIEARRSDLSPRAALPLGLELGESRASALAKLRNLSPSAVRKALLSRARSGPNAALSSGFCVEVGAADPASFYLRFDDEGQLAALGLRLDA